MIRGFLRWVSPQARKARVREVQGDLLAACEHYLHAGLDEDAARVLERHADAAAHPTEVRLRHYQQAYDLLENLQPVHQERVASKMLPLLEGSPVGSAAFRCRCDLLRRCGRDRELGAELERAGDLQAALQVYVEAGLLDEIDRLSENGDRRREGRKRIEQWMETLEQARHSGDRLQEWQALRHLATDEEARPRAASFEAELARLEPRLLGSVLLLESDALRTPIEIRVASSLTIGRDAETDLRLPAPGVSRRNTRLYVYGDALYAEDLGSTNGTWLDGLKIDGYLRVTGSQRLGIGSQLELTLSALQLGPDEAPSAWLEGRVLGRPHLLLGGPALLGSASGTIPLRHPALEMIPKALRLLPRAGQLLVAPVPGGPPVTLGGRPLEEPRLPFLGESIAILGVDFVFRRLHEAPPASWSGQFVATL